MSAVTYQLCYRCGADLGSPDTKRRLCRDCWECETPLSAQKLARLEAEDAAELARENYERRLTQYREYRRVWTRGARAQQRLAATQQPAYHAAYIERYDVARIAQEAS